MAKLNSLEDLYMEKLQDVYDAEQQIVKALPKMAKAATAPELKQSFEMHMQQSQDQAARIEQIFEQIGSKAKGKPCKAMQGIIAEGEELMSKGGDPSVMDAGLIAAAQKVEHYEIAGYGTLRTWANLLGHQEAASLLQQTLNEEEQTDKKLTQLAEKIINVQAAGR